MTLRLVIFDCDGVLIDSEALCNRVVAADLTRFGWPLTPEECQHLFVGLTFADTKRAAEAYLQRPLGEGWVDDITRRVTAVMAEEATAIPGARAALEATIALGLPFRVASNSSHPEMAAKFTRTGLADLIDGRIHSAHDVISRGGRGKPAPDLFLEAAAAENVAPADCVVIEDSWPAFRRPPRPACGAWPSAPTKMAPRCKQAGALPFASMFALPALLRTLTGPA